MEVVADTSALLSLEAGGVLEIAVEKLDFMASTFKLIESLGLLCGRNFYEKRNSKALLSSNN